MKSVLKLGTRRSLLAWAQSTWVARQIESQNPELQVELVGIDTRGDRITDVPLSQIQGKEFFVAEIDEALRSRAVDLTVHSLKDLSLDRPKEFTCAAIPKRENSRDVILFGPQALNKIAAGKGETLRIGTSSPRRLENIPPFLNAVLPHFAATQPKIEFLEIRGNVNTRLSRVHEPPQSTKNLDGVVLAFAGLIRLWNSANGHEDLKHLLRGVRWMVLPLAECPAAPGQGALAIECRAGDDDVKAAIGKIHHEVTASHVKIERGLLEEWGGGCHQRFGATVSPSRELGNLFHIRGAKPDGTFVEELRWNEPKVGACKPKPWDGTEFKTQSEKLNPSPSQLEKLEQAEAVFVANVRAVPESWLPILAKKRVWVSGTTSWRKLAEQGIWVEGCAEGLGFDDLTSTLQEGVLQLPPVADWLALTHESAVSGWTQGQPLATHRILKIKDPQAIEAAQGASHFFWSSSSQFDAYRELAPADAHHACGAGKTAAHIRANVQTKNFQVFPSVKEWRKWTLEG